MCIKYSTWRVFEILSNTFYNSSRILSINIDETVCFVKREIL